MTLFQRVWKEVIKIHSVKIYFSNSRVMHRPEIRYIFDETQCRLVHYIELDESFWLESDCDCAKYLRNYICRHIVELALKNRCLKLPRKAFTVKITKKATAASKSKAILVLKK